MMSGEVENVGTAVIGGGPAGCAAAMRLARAGHRTTLFEAEPWLGGRTRTVHDGDFTIDSGAFYIGNLYRETLAAIEESGHSNELLPMERRTWLYDRGERRDWVMGSAGSLFGHPRLRPRDKIRAAGVFAAKSAIRPDPFSTEELADADTGESVAAWARRALGERTYEYLVRPSFEPWWLFRCEAAAGTLWTGFLRDAPKLELLAFPEGTDSVCRWMAEDVDVRLECPVAGVESDGAGFNVTFETGGQLRADRVVLATDAQRAAALLGSGAAAERLARTPYAASLHVSLCYRSSKWEHCAGSVFPGRPDDSDVATVSLASKKIRSLAPPGGEIVDVYFKDAASRRIAAADAVEHALRGAAELLGTDMPEPETTHVFDRDRGVAAPAPGHYAAMMQVHSLLPPGMEIAGDYLSAGVIEGAIRSGREAAARLVGAK